MTYVFDSEIAEKYGVEEAIIIQNFTFWIMTNKAKNKNYHNGRTWTYNSIDAMKELFPFWTTNQIRRIINSLIEKNVLIKDNFNKVSYDRTAWYAFDDESLFIPEMDKNGNRKIYHGYIYLIKDDKGKYKIGLSKDVNRRLKEYKNIEIISKHETFDTYGDEKKLHEKFKNKRIAGEWFNLDENDIKSISIWRFAQMENCENGNEIVENAKPIPNINTNDKPNSRKKRENALVCVDSVIEFEPALQDSLRDFIQYRKEIRCPVTALSLKMLVKKLETMYPKNYESQCAVLQQSIVNGWKGVFPLKTEQRKNNGLDMSDPAQIAAAKRMGLI